jgi:hypothetical protein
MTTKSWQNSGLGSIQIFIILNIHKLFITEEFANVENSDSNIVFKTLKSIFHQKGIMIGI